ncbi:MAG TPA: PLP-dependent aminotransferase family protein [Victivallales bacterium]|nr:PLP-dependent aminotransferase family protein [Victivallales bacterium]
MLKIKINRSLEKPLYAQIRDKIINSIKDGVIKKDERLPTVVGLAKDIGVTQATINRAFEDLTKDGWIISYVGRGTFVSLPNSSETETNKIDQRQKDEHLKPEFVLAARRLRMGIAQSLNSLWALSNRPDLIKFHSPTPPHELIADNVLSMLFNKAVSKGEYIYHGYGHPQGLFELRKAIASQYMKYDINISPEQIIITSGAQQAISILAQFALENKQRVICETPCYTGVPNAFGASGHWVETLPREYDGPKLDKLEKFKDGRPSLLYMCPEIHNPMGTDTSEEKLIHIYKWLKSENSFLIYDDTFKELRYDKLGCKYSKHINLNNTIIIGSLSKSFMCGLRIGWLISIPKIINSLLELKSAIDITTPSLMQGMAFSLLTSDYFNSHLEKAKKYYKLRRDTLIDSLNKYMPKSIKWTTPPGGFHLWCELPEGYSSIALYLLALERGVIICPGPRYDIDHRFMNAFNMGYGLLEINKIIEGVELLGDAVKELLSTHPADSGMSGLGDFI